MASIQFRFIIIMPFSDSETIAVLQSRGWYTLWRIGTAKARSERHQRNFLPICHQPLPSPTILHQLLSVEMYTYYTYEFLPQSAVEIFTYFIIAPIIQTVIVLDCQWRHIKSIFSQIHPNWLNGFISEPQQQNCPHNCPHNRSGQDMRNPAI